MISILVCSVKPDLRAQLEKNIEQTIGVPYELLVHDNRNNSKGLCEVYNALAAKAQYSILCFVHEDVLFKTKEWGRLIQEIYTADANIGLVGIAGSKYKSRLFSGWFTGQNELDCAHVIHRYTTGDETILLKPNEENSIEEVVCLDGVFICASKEIWQSVKFDDINLKGFHLYDIDFSLRAAQVCRVMVTYSIELIHITHGGDFGNNWIESSMQYHQRIQHNLPFTKLIAYKKEMEVKIAKTNMDFLKTHDISVSKKIKWVKLQKLYLYPQLLYAIIKFYIYKPLHLKHVHQLMRSNG